MSKSVHVIANGALIKMDNAAYFRSQTREFEALRDRVRMLLGSATHWPTDGEWKESVLRSALSQRLPESVKIGRGFIISEVGPTTQCDIIIYRGDYPVLFRDGDLVFVTPEAVLAIIEVKTSIDPSSFGDAIYKLNEVGVKLGDAGEHCVLSLFSYKSSYQRSEEMLEILSEHCLHRMPIIQLINLGCSSFIKWWSDDPVTGAQNYNQWHAYDMVDMSAGYFMANILDAISPKPLGRSTLWFPDQGKEQYRKSCKAHNLTSP